MSAVITFLATASSVITQGAQQACGSSCNTGTSVNTLFASAANALIFVIGAISAIMILFGGLRYAYSRGDSAVVKAAKETIIYAVTGLVVAIAAFAIVNFVVKNIK